MHNAIKLNLIKLSILYIVQSNLVKIAYKF